MATDSNNEAFERWWAATPESKLELIDGQLIYSTLRGSRRMLWYLLDDYGPAIALPLAPAHLWWAALNQAFAPQPEPATPEQWTAWAATFEYQAEPEPAGPHGSGPHRGVYERLQHGLSHFAYTSGLGRELGRDFVVRLGEHGLTPDLLFIDRARLANLHEYYLDGPPALVIEITLEGSADQDRTLKYRLYEQARIPEYWLVEAEQKQILFWRLGRDGRYEPVMPDPQGIYHSAAAPGLTLSVHHLWTMDRTDWEQPWLPFLPAADRDERPLPERQPDPDELGWDSLPFAPRVGLQPVPIRFEEFISWCPQAKLERYGEGLAIGGHEGSRRVTGMLLMTFGLVEAVRLAHPREWITFLHPEPYQAVVERQTEALLRQARYQTHEWSRGRCYVHGEIPELPDVSTGGETLTECQHNLAEMVRRRVLLKIARRQEIPTVE
jgi:Uma2 family endonuclease